MARTVTVSFSTSTAKAGQRVHGLVEVASTDTNPIQVSKIMIYPSALAASLTVTQPDLGSGGGAGLGPERATRQTIVNPSTSAFFPFDVAAHNPQAPGAASIAYTLNAVVTFSDGATATNNAVLTVGPPVS